MATYNDRIKELRIQNHLTLKDIAAKLNITEATAQRYESGNGIKAVPYEKIVEYACLFNVSPAFIMGWEENKPQADIEKALELYDQYKKSIPQVQNAVDALLKPPLSDS